MPKQIVRQAPYLRRYARALTGDQSTADNYVRVSLQAVAAGENLPDETLPPRAALYHTFHAIWRTTGARLEPTEDDISTLGDPSHRLLRIAPRSRQAFLLTALEGFTLSETAQILDADFAERSKALAANQGLYNGFLVAGLVWGLVSGRTDVRVFFLVCVVVAGVYGAATVSKRILVVQAVPAAVALAAVAFS